MGHRLAADVLSEIAERAGNPSIPPVAILPGQMQYQTLDGVSACSRFAALAPTDCAGALNRRAVSRSYSSSPYGELTRAVARSMTFTNGHLEIVAWLPKAAAYWLEASSDLRVWRWQASTRIGPALAVSFSYTGVASNYVGKQFFRIGGGDGLPPGLP